jgi:hypothetical protein
MAMNETLILREETIASIIYLIRGEKVMLDVDLAELYGVETKILKQAVRRNLNRFPPDFLFELTKEEDAHLREQFGASNIGRGGARYLPFAFTEQGVAMLSGILNSERAISVNIAIMRTFVQMRKLMFSNAELSQRVGDLERLMNEHLDDYSEDIKDIYEALRQLMRDQDEEEPRRPIGFK